MPPVWKYQTALHDLLAIRLRENFDQKGNFYLVMDLISGGEMFDHLADGGPYSEADAAHLVRDTASALAFLHGVGLVSADWCVSNDVPGTVPRRPLCCLLAQY